MVKTAPSSPSTEPLIGYPLTAPPAIKPAVLQVDWEVAPLLEQTDPSEFSSYLGRRLHCEKNYKLTNPIRARRLQTITRLALTALGALALGSAIGAAFMLGATFTGGVSCAIQVALLTGVPVVIVGWNVISDVCLRSFQDLKWLVSTYDHTDLRERSAHCKRVKKLSFEEIMNELGIHEVEAYRLMDGVIEMHTRDEGKALRFYHQVREISRIYKEIEGDYSRKKAEVDYEFRQAILPVAKWRDRKQSRAKQFFDGAHSDMKGLQGDHALQPIGYIGINMAQRNRLNTIHTEFQERIKLWSRWKKDQFSELNHARASSMARLEYLYQRTIQNLTQEVDIALSPCALYL